MATAKSKKPKGENPNNPYRDKPFSEIEQMIYADADKIIAAIDAIAKTQRDADGKEIKPRKDLAGLTKYATLAFNGQFKPRMMKAGGMPDPGAAIDRKADTLRKKLLECAKMAEELKDETKDAVAQLKTQEEIYAQNNVEKIAEQLKAEQLKAEKAAERIKELTAISARTSAKASGRPAAN